MPFYFLPHGEVMDSGFCCGAFCNLCYIFDNKKNFAPNKIPKYSHNCDISFQFKENNMTEVRRFKRSLLDFITGRNLACALFLCAVVGILAYTLSVTQVVRIIDGSREFLTYTTEIDATRLMGKFDIEVDENDRVYLTEDIPGEYQEMMVERAFPVNVVADGMTVKAMSTAVTVDKLLAEQNISLGELDRLNMNLSEVVGEGDEIVLQRVEQEITQEQEAIPFQTVYQSTSLLNEGNTRVLQEGRDGVRTLTYSQTTVDNQVQDKELLSSDITRSPITNTILIDDGSPISRLDYSGQFPLDENGIPLNYVEVFTDQVATGYYAGAGSWGASGGECFAGTVAVRADQFPYGTKLYIRTPEGDFIYGYSVSNDTGTGLMANIIDVDLYYETFTESALNGRRMVDIYVLEYTPQSIYTGRYAGYSP